MRHNCDSLVYFFVNRAQEWPINSRYLAMSSVNATNIVHGSLGRWEPCATILLWVHCVRTRNLEKGICQLSGWMLSNSHFLYNWLILSRLWTTHFQTSWRCADSKHRCFAHWDTWCHNPWIKSGFEKISSIRSSILVWYFHHEGFMVLFSLETIRLNLKLNLWNSKLFVAKKLLFAFFPYFSFLWCWIKLNPVEWEPETSIIFCIRLSFNSFFRWLSWCLDTQTLQWTQQKYVLTELIDCNPYSRWNDLIARLKK